MQPEKFRLDPMATYQPLFTFTYLIFAKPCQWLEHYYKTKYEDTPYKCVTRSNSKWLTIGHYSPI